MGAGAKINRIFSHLKYQEEKHFRADSAYCNEEVIRACIKHGSRFTVTAHGNTGWESKVSQITDWKPWKYTEEEIQWAAEKKRSLPEIEVRAMLYRPSWAENLRFYVAVKRTRVEQAGLFAQDGWKYYGVITNWSADEIFTIAAFCVVLDHFLGRFEIEIDPFGSATFSLP